MTPEILTDTVLEWFESLNYEYMILHVIICYGLYYSDNLRWVVEYFNPIRKKGISKAVWLVGGILALLEIIRFLPFVSENNLSLSVVVEKILSILHSYIVIQVFVEPLVNLMRKWMVIFNKNSNNTTDNH